MQRIIERWLSRKRLISVEQQSFLRVRFDFNHCVHDIIAFRMGRRRRELYAYSIGHARCVCLSPTAFPHYSTDPDV